MKGCISCWNFIRVIQKELKDFEDNLLPLGLLVLALGLRIFKSPDYVRLINFEISGFIFTFCCNIEQIGNFKIEEKIKNFGDIYSKLKI